MRLDNLEQVIAPARRPVLALGLAALVAITIPAVRRIDWPVVDITLWSCWAFFFVDTALAFLRPVRVDASWQALTQWQTVVGLLVVIPVPAGFLAGLPAPTAWLFASFWLLKLQSATAGISLFSRVIRQQARPLAAVISLFLFVLFFAAVAMHVLERGAQPERFGNLAGAMYWAVTTLTTTGYGDTVPVTPAGRLLAGLVMIGGLAVFGLWTGVLATGFAAETRRRDFIRSWELVARVPFFRGLGPAAIIDIAQKLRSEDYPERTVVIRRGREGDSMYFIAEGEVEVAGNGPPVRLRAGAFFGEMALLARGVRNATVTTIIPSTLLVLEVTDFHVLTAHYPELARTVEQEALRRGLIQEKTDPAA